MATSGVGFSFELPLEVKEILSDTSIEVNQLGGDILPDWIKFDAKALIFKFGAVPQGGLPIQLGLSNQTTTVAIVVSKK
jgi:hypothetical protein